jgi:uncharacterized RDD family membrane protein YckC
VTVGAHKAAKHERRRVASPAPLWRRFVGSVVDGALAFAPLAVVLASTSDGGVRTALTWVAVLVSIAIVIVNDIVLVARRGQSLGRRLFAIQVVDGHTMRPPGLLAVLVRGFVGTLQFGYAWHPFGLPFMVLVGPWPVICYAPVLFDRQWRRGLHDRWSGTVVIDVSDSR